jgi:NADH:ubiquinone oxidoreductase subunit C
LDYSFEGNPLLKQFSSIGYDELEYDLRERWLLYKPLKIRDNIEIWNN